MKPLELTVYPPIPPMPIGKWEIDERRMWWQDRADELDDRDAKRLTDADLAAEVWHSIVRFNTLCPSPQAAEEARRNGILERFATLPHYDQEEATA